MSEITPQETVKRLDLAIEIMQRPMEDLPIDRWDMNIFGLKASEEASCSTAACGVGTLSLTPEFNALGLTGRFRYDRFEGDYSLEAVDQKNLRLDFEDAVSLAIGITVREAMLLQDNDTNFLDVSNPCDGNADITRKAFVRRLKVLRAIYLLKS